MSVARGLLNIPKVNLGQAIIWENFSPSCQDPSNVMPESQLAGLKMFHFNPVYQAGVTCIMYIVRVMPG